MKRFFAILLALMMIMSLATTAFAANSDTYTITINNTTAGHTYEAYQIFVGDLSGQANPDSVDGTNAVLSNVLWGTGVTIPTDGITLKNGSKSKDAAVVAAALADENLELDSLLSQLTLTSTKATSTYTAKTDDKEAYYTISNLDAGYYLVKDKDNSLDGKEGEAYTKFIMEVVENSVVKPKSSVPGIDKMIGNGDPTKEWPDVNEAGVGETVNYMIRADLPSNLTDYEKYYFKLTDTLSAGLTYNSVSLDIRSGTTKLNDYFTISNTTSTTGETIITFEIEDLLKLRNENTILTIGNSGYLLFSYSATVNENAVVSPNSNPNEAYLEYSNDPNYNGDGKPGDPDYPTGVTPPSKVETYMTEVIINKVDGNGNALKGAEFKIVGDAKQVIVETQEEFTEDVNGDYWKLTNGTYTTTAPSDDTAKYYDDTTTKYSATTVEVLVPDSPVSANFSATAEVDESGKLVFSGLGAGTYTITETKTPAGYNTIAAPIGLEISFDAATKEFSYTWTNATADADNAASIDVINQAGSTLPETGGVGTTLFYIFGGLMMVGAVVLLVTKKRMAN